MENSNSTTPNPSDTLTSRLRRWFAPLTSGAARLLVRLHISPNALTVAGLVMAVIAAVFASQGQFVRAGITLILGTPLDAMDGAVARESGKVTRAGAFLDSTLDRYGEAFVLAGLCFYLATTGALTGVVLAFAALFGSVMVSYLRARSEGLGIDNKVGLLTRVERIVITVLALLTGWIMPGLWVLAILTHVTVFQRLIFALRALSDSNG